VVVDQRRPLPRLPGESILAAAEESLCALREEIGGARLDFAHRAPANPICAAARVLASLSEDG
jgi:hypothetical protein